MKQLVAALAAVGMLAACGAAQDLPTADEQDTASRGTKGVNASQQLLVLADSFFAFDPTLDVAKTAEENATAIQARTTSSCASVSVSGATVTVSMPPPGCIPSSRLTAQGTFNLTVQRTPSPASLSVMLGMTEAVVNGTSYAGTVDFVTSNATTFTVASDFTAADITYQSNLTVTGGPDMMTVDGTLSQGTGTTLTSYTFTGLTYHAGDCYPSGGTVAVKKGVITTTMTFTAQTARFGEVTVTSGRKTWTAMLPAYGESCPVSTI